MDSSKPAFVGPAGTSQLAVDKEIREIDAKLRASDFRDSLQLVSHWAVRPDDLLQFLNQHQPHVVHFRGHGSEENEILLLSDTGSTIVTGNHNVTSVQFTQTTLPPAESIDVQAEFAALRQILEGLQAADQKKIDRALEDAADEIAKPQPDRDEIGRALDRALRYARQAESFAATAGKLQTHITNTVSWLGDAWHNLLPLVGLTL